MATELLARALTSLSRVKDKLKIDSTVSDPVLERLIMGATDYIERICNRKFKEATYTNEVSSVPGSNAKYILLKNIPVTTLTTVQYRAGSPASPTWTSFQTDDYQLCNDGASGLVQVAGRVPSGVNSVRTTYTAGYKIDFTKVTDAAFHTLPFDLSDLCERMVTKMYKKRDQEGQSSSTTPEGGTVTWEGVLNDFDREVLNSYKRPPAFV